jgi:hypothetical protein
MKLEDQIIIIVSNEEWGNTWYSKHNYAWELSKKNTIYFINPPKKFKPFNIFRKSITEIKIANNLYAITYSNILPVRFDFLRIVNEFFVFKKINTFLKRRNASDSIFWTFDPIRLTSPEILKPKKIILHMVDKYQFTHHGEVIIARKADIIICVAEDIADGFYSLNDHVFVVPHAIASEEFLKVTTKRDDGIKQGIYVGNIDSSMDFKITQYLINRFPNVEFHFVGKINSTNNKLLIEFLDKKYPNVIYHGEKPFKELKQYISRADFCFLFKDVNHPGANISSHKMLQYFAQGKPVFSTILNKYEILKDDNLLFMTNDKNKLGDLLEDYLINGEDSSIINKRIDYAQAHSFDITLKKIEELLA